MNNEIKMNDEPEKAEGPNKVLNSKWSFLTIKDSPIDALLEVSQYKGEQNIKIKKELDQFKGRLKFEAGSKTENKLVIMFTQCKINWI